MGNSLLRNYNIDKDPHLSSGFKNLWKIYNGSRKDRKQDVSIWVIEKKSLDKYPKDEREEILNVLKKEANSLIKYKHPGILSIVEPLIEDKQTMVFVTEPIQYSLASWVESGNVSKLEIKLMIAELCGVLSFLHEDAKVIHANLTLDNAFITNIGHVKLSGMCFSFLDSSVSGSEFRFNNTIPNAMPCLKHVAPEIIYNNTAYYNSDIYSLGSIIYTLLKMNRNDSDKELISISNNTSDSYKRQYESIESKLNRLNFESDDNEIILKATNRRQEYRPAVKELMEYVWFNDPKLKALRFIENMETNDAAKNNEFLSKFPNILYAFDNKIIERRFLPAFMNAIKIETLIAPVLPALFAICESEHKVDFEGVIWPGLKVLFGIKQMPAAALYFILSKINFLADKISNTEFSSNMLNIICKALDCGVAKIQAVVLENLIFIIKKIDSLAFKNQIFPRLVNIVLNTSSNSLKVAILKSWTTVYSLLDQNLINESLLNTLEKIRKNDNNSEICMCLVNIYEEIAKVVSIEVKFFKCSLLQIKF
jgi:SCY1-like protein 2